METFWVILLWSMRVIYVVACAGLIVVVLLQKGKGAGFAGAFGVGPGSDTVFGPRARKSLPVKITYAMAALYMILAMGMSLVLGRTIRGSAPEAVDVTETTDAFDSLTGLGTASEAPAESDAGAPAEMPATATPDAAPSDAPAQSESAAPVQPTEIVLPESGAPGSEQPAAPAQ